MKYPQQRATLHMHWQIIYLDECMHELLFYIKSEFVKLVIFYRTFLSTKPCIELIAFSIHAVGNSHIIKLNK